MDFMGLPFVIVKRSGALHLRLLILPLLDVGPGGAMGSRFCLLLQ